MTSHRHVLVAGLAIAACGDRRVAPAHRGSVASDAGRGGRLADEPAPLRDASPDATPAPADVPPSSGDEMAVLECVGDWHAGPQVLKFWGNHPDYPADAADAYRTDRDEVIELRYQVQDGRLRLWRDDALLADVAFTLSRDEHDPGVHRYQLRLDAPVFEHDHYDGVVATSFWCIPPVRPMR